MSALLLIIVIAVTVEAFVEYLKSLIKAFTQGQIKTAITQIVAVSISSTLCFTAGADMYAALGIAFSSPWLGTLLTGIFASRGANYVSDMLKRLQGLKIE